MSRVEVGIPYKDYDGQLQFEKVDAVPCGNSYQIVGTPFFAENIAYNYVIDVDEENGEFYFDNHVQCSEYSTVQVVFFDAKDVPLTVDALSRLGCSSSVLSGHPYISIIVPPNVEYSSVFKFLKRQEQSKVSSFKEACLSDKHQADVS